MLSKFTKDKQPARYFPITTPFLVTVYRSSYMTCDLIHHFNFPESKMLLLHLVCPPQRTLRSIIENSLVFVHLRSLVYVRGTR